MTRMNDEEMKDLHERAEAVLARGEAFEASPAPEDQRTLIHDLRVHQVELEMQNEELRASRNELEIARDGYARLYNQSPVGYISLDESGIIRKANQTFMDLFGIDEAGLKGRSFSDFLRDEEKADFLGRYGAIFRRPEGKTLTIRPGVRRKGLVVELNARRENQGKTLLVIVQDVSERVAAQEALKEAEHLWSEIFESMSDAVWTLDRDGQILRYNSASERLLGAQPSELSGCLCYDAMHDEPGRPEDCPYLRMKESLKRESSVIRRRGRWLEVTVDPLLDGSGNLIGTVHITKDITARKDANDRIESLLAEKQLLLQEVHHRIKNNMNVATSLLDLQADGMDNPEAKAALEDASRRFLSMMIIYDKLYRSGDFRSIQAAEYLGELVRGLGEQFASSRVVIKASFDDAIMDSAVLSPLGIIMNELITNCFKYAFPGQREGTIEVRLSRLSDASWELLIADDGVGLPASFEKHHSKGFGLVLVRTLAAQVSGTLEIRSEAGTEFRISFPAPGRTSA